MDKIYRRPTQLGGTPKMKKNEKKRKRNVIMNFRVSPEEKELIDARIALTGLSRAEFFIESCLYQTVLVKGNIRSFSEIKKQVAQIADAVDRNPHLEDLELGQAQMLKTILEIIDRRFRKEGDYGDKDI